VKEYMPSEFPPAGAALVWMLNGTGRLREESRPLPEPHVDRLFFQSALMLDGKDLIRWRCSECPTCPFLLEATGLSPEEVTASDAAINSWTMEKLSSARPRRWVKDYLPLLSLCNPGFYWVTVTRHFPTDGNGRFFWSEIPPNHPQDLLQFKWGAKREDPAFLLPTQRTAAFNSPSWERARQTHQSHPGVALFLGGYGSALLDGHHRATAAATEGLSFPCVTFIPERSIGQQKVVFPPLPAPGWKRLKRIGVSESVRSQLKRSSRIPLTPQPVNDFVPAPKPIPIIDAAQHGVRAMPTTYDWMNGVLLRQFFGGTINDKQWTTLLKIFLISSNPSPDFKRKISTSVRTETGTIWKTKTVYTTFELLLAQAILGLRVLDDPSWPQRWEEALEAPLTDVNRKQLGFWFSRKPPLTKMRTDLLSQLLHRNETKNPRLVADLRARFKL
jgi:hypothetical protein